MFGCAGAKAYGGWESPNYVEGLINGHFTGHLLSALAFTVYGARFHHGFCYVRVSNIACDCCAVRVFRQESTFEDAIGSHACSLEASMHVTNGTPLGCSLLLPVGTVNCVPCETLKGNLPIKQQAHCSLGEEGRVFGAYTFTWRTCTFSSATCLSNAHFCLPVSLLSILCVFDYDLRVDHFG
jgi:hypothetical protein